MNGGLGNAGVSAGQRVRSARPLGPLAAGPARTRYRDLFRAARRTGALDDRGLGGPDRRGLRASAQRLRSCPDRSRRARRRVLACPDPRARGRLAGTRTAHRPGRRQRDDRSRLAREARRVACNHRRTPDRSPRSRSDAAAHSDRHSRRRSRARTRPSPVGARRFSSRRLPPWFPAGSISRDGPGSSAWGRSALRSPGRRSLRHGTLPAGACASTGCASISPSASCLPSRARKAPWRPL